MNNLIGPLISIGAVMLLVWSATESWRWTFVAFACCAFLLSLALMIMTEMNRLR
jgi:hypothetical protein